MLTRFILLLLIASAPLAAQSDSARRAWLATNTAPIRSLAFNERDDGDLTAIGRAIGDRRFVLLGEQTHGDGATFRAKARLIRYLHERLDFDMLVFESGFYDCHRTWVDARGGVSLADSASGCMFEVWSNSAQVRPLLEYMDARKGTARPLELAGSDFQPSGSKAREMLADLRRFLEAQPDSAGMGSLLLALQTSYGRMLSTPGGPQNAPDSVQSLLRSVLDRLVALPLRDVPARGYLGEAAFWRQAVGGIWPFITVMQELGRGGLEPEIMNRRDAVMGANLIWLANRHPTRKIIVWGATSHLLRDRVGIENDPAPSMIPAGHVLHHAFPGQVYTVGFLGAGGEYGASRRGAVRPATAVPVADTSSIDGLWRDTGQELAFLDLRRIPAGGEWLNAQLVAGVLGYGAMRSSWPHHLDALFLIRSMTPSTPVVSGVPR